MPKFAANLSFLFQELDFLDRFDAAARAGFRGVEYLFPYNHDPAAIETRLKRNGLTQVLFNAAPGNWAAGERGLGALPGREQEFRDAVKLALDYARALGCERIHAMAGIPPAGVPAAELESVFAANLHAAAGLLAPHGIVLLIEPINTRDIPGYFLTGVEQALRIIGQAAAPNLFLQLDLYHRQIMGGDLAETVRTAFPLTRHYQIAGVPGRHEPDVGEINYPYLFDLIDKLGYDGWIGCEYRPKGRTVDGLGWAGPWGIRTAV
ncbi:MAG: hydroxypyruvate isomerase family protein [Rhodospirillaceae bacterium]|nr:hydroxypyruvate isomerase family protein [Rhodospirillaceae bacterium]